MPAPARAAITLTLNDHVGWCQRRCFPLPGGCSLPLVSMACYIGRRGRSLVGWCNRCCTQQPLHMRRAPGGHRRATLPAPSSRRRAQLKGLNGKATTRCALGASPADEALLAEPGPRCTVFGPVPFGLSA